jgi:hypothetical protein
LKSLQALSLLAPLGVAAQGPVQAKAIEPFRMEQRAGLSRAGVALVASAVLPGAGQLYLGEQRWVPYVALEAWGWISFFNQKSQAASLERQYRKLAWDVARRGCGCVRRDSTFPYYEAMAGVPKSGEFDGNMNVDGVQPELDANTFNGQQWLRAKALYLPGGVELPPGTREYESALDYYKKNAIPRGYRWNWGDSDLEQETFNRLIDKSDDSFRTATRTLGLILANHMVSAVDALITARLQAVTKASNPLDFESGLEPQNGAILLKATIRIPFGN